MPQISDQTMRELTDTFQLFDKNRDGCIARDELVVVMRLLGQNPTNSQAEEWIKAMDKSGNGKIEFSEFVECVGKVGIKTTKEEADEILAAFKIIDSDGNGYITSSELCKIMTTMGERMTDEEAKAMIKEADLNGDNRIDYKEFAQVMARKH